MVATFNDRRRVAPNTTSTRRKTLAVCVAGTRRVKPWRAGPGATWRRPNRLVPIIKSSSPESRRPTSIWSIWRPPDRARPCLPGARPAGGPNPKRPAARRRRSADGASRAPRDRARPAHAHGLASTAPLSAAESAPSAPSGSSWHSSASSRRSAAPTPCALSHTRSSACAFRATGSPQLDSTLHISGTRTRM